MLIPQRRTCIFGSWVRAGLMENGVLGVGQPAYSDIFGKCMLLVTHGGEEVCCCLLKIAGILVMYSGKMGTTFFKWGVYVGWL